LQWTLYWFAQSARLYSQEIVTAVVDSGLRGRGGAAFPTGIKWQTVHDAPSNQKVTL